MSWRMCRQFLALQSAYNTAATRRRLGACAVVFLRCRARMAQQPRVLACHINCEAHARAEERGLVLHTLAARACDSVA